MESQPQSPEFRNNPENFHPCTRELATHAPMNDIFVLQNVHRQTTDIL